MKRKRLSIIFALVFAFIICLPNKAEAKKFKDTKGHRYEKYIDWATNQGLMVSFKDGTFMPDSPVLRSDLIVTINNLYDSGKGNPRLTFDDNEAYKLKQSRLNFYDFDIMGNNGKYDYKLATRIEAVQLFASVFNFYTTYDKQMFPLTNEDLSWPLDGMKYEKREVEILLKMGKKLDC